MDFVGPSTTLTLPAPELSNNYTIESSVMVNRTESNEYWTTVIFGSYKTQLNFKISNVERESLIDFILETGNGSITVDGVAAHILEPTKSLTGARLAEACAKDEYEVSLTLQSAERIIL